MRKKYPFFTLTTRGKMDIRKNRWNLTDKALTDDFALSNMQNIA